MVQQGVDAAGVGAQYAKGVRLPHANPPHFAVPCLHPQQWETAARLPAHPACRLTAGVGRGQPVREERRRHGVAICEDGGGHGEGRGGARLPPGAAAAPGTGARHTIS